MIIPFLSWLPVSLLYVAQLQFFHTCLGHPLHFGTYENEAKWWWSHVGIIDGGYSRWSLGTHPWLLLNQVFLFSTIRRILPKKKVKIIFLHIKTQRYWEINSMSTFQRLGKFKTANEYEMRLDDGNWKAKSGLPWRTKDIISTKVDAKKYHGHDLNLVWTQKYHFSDILIQK